MSAPDTDLEKQKKRHGGPLAGMGGVALVAVALLVGLTIWLVFAGEEPRDASTSGGATGEQAEGN